MDPATIAIVVKAVLDLVTPWLRPGAPEFTDEQVDAAIKRAEAFVTSHLPEDGE